MAPPEKTTPALNRPSSPSASSSDESEEIVHKNKNVEDTESEDDESQQSGDKSDSDDGDNSGSDSDSHERTPSPTASDFAVKPISSKPMDNNKPKKKPTPNKPTSAPEPKPGSKRPAKDPNPNGNSGSGKNKKVKVEEEKKTTNYRLWSEDDEVAIMKGVLDFKTKRGSDAFTDRGAFYEFVKKSFSVDVAQSQLWDKARRMKKKYQALLENRVNGEEDPVFQKPVEYKCYQLAKKVWGNSDGGNAVEGSAKTSANTKKKPTNTNTNTNTNKPLKSDNPLASPKPESKSKAITLPEKKSNGVVEDGNKADEDDFYSMFPELVGSLGAENVNLSVPEEVANVVKEKMPLIGAVKAKELEERWKNLRAEQIRLFLKQLDLVREQTKMVLDAMEASKP